MRKSTVLGILGFLALHGCTGSLQMQSRATYVAPGGVTMERLAILPVRSLSGLEGMQRTTADTVHSQVVQRYPDKEVIPADSTRRLLNDAGLVQQYSDMLTAYQNTDVLDQAVLEEMREAVGANHFLYVTVSYEEERPGTFDNDPTQVMSMSGHIWSAADGDVVWEGSTSLRRPVNEELEDLRPLGELLGAAADGLATRMP